MSEQDPILYEKDPTKKIARITLNRPERLNALRLEHYAQITELVHQAEEDDDVKVILFRGNGRSFCSGHDVGELGFMYGLGTRADDRRPSQRVRLLRDRSIVGFFRTVAFCLKSTVAAVHGYCYGGGLNVALACDQTIAAEGALFTHPGYRYIGPTLDFGILAATVGIKMAKQVMLTGIPVEAQDAYRMGLVNKVVSPDRLEEEANALCEAMAQLPIDGIVMGKAHMQAAMNAMGVGTAYDIAYMMHSLQTNIRYEEGEFNLFRERRERGVSGAIRARKEHYSEALPRP